MNRILESKSAICQAGKNTNRVSGATVTSDRCNAYRFHPVRPGTGRWSTPIGRILLRSHRGEPCFGYEDDAVCVVSLNPVCNLVHRHALGPLIGELKAERMYEAIATHQNSYGKQPTIKCEHPFVYFDYLWNQFNGIASQFRLTVALSRSCVARYRLQTFSDLSPGLQVNM